MLCSAQCCINNVYQLPTSYILHNHHQKLRFVYHLNPATLWQRLPGLRTYYNNTPGNKINNIIIYSSCQIENWGILIISLYTRNLYTFKYVFRIENSINIVPICPASYYYHIILFIVDLIQTVWNRLFKTLSTQFIQFEYVSLM